MLLEVKEYLDLEDQDRFWKVLKEFFPRDF
jgi:hypothetical protein